jgi:hypothetical protein
MYEIVSCVNINFLCPKYTQIKAKKAVSFSSTNYYTRKRLTLVQLTTTQIKAKKAAQLKIINSRRGDLTPSQMPAMGAQEGQRY